jgi:hypothetical protein
MFIIFIPIYKILSSAFQSTQSYYNTHDEFMEMALLIWCNKQAEGDLENPTVLLFELSQSIET